ncbi:DnaA N-terminal domain-containing protein [Cognatiyoonia sediminum]|uniref:DnaA N-terminal domain-containing protein n=1 Tax=Cognatiyoonia sediminum TaxID=1508389 RepID=A0A1M5T872_9RHOB|nr:DnaA N-terminal domain-containing protein [Cognatiyoonia sediminum]SHH46914.1 DnaA N-terminal domain-containing protein [Cognatiyoonia sediminum]
MLVAKPVGRDAATKKYDILSALATFGLSKDKHKQRQILRLMALITTRYNWQCDELSMGQAEIARLWSVDTRTVKREMARLRSLGWLVQKRQGARGRVSVYGLDLARVMADTQPTWDNIGPDFVQRMGAEPQQSDTNVIPFRNESAVEFSNDVWGRACKVLHVDDPSTFASWIALLKFGGDEAGQIVLVAPSRFHATYVTSHLQQRILYALRAQDPSISAVQIIAQ